MTLANGDYRRVLLAALGCAMSAFACLAVPYNRGPAVWRVAAVAIGLPLLLVLYEVARRLPYVFIER